MAKQTVEQIMSRELHTVHVDWTLEEAATRMRKDDVGFLLVVDSDEVIGVISDRDIVVRGLAEGFLPEDTAISSVMQQRLVTCRPDMPVEEASEIMKTHDIHRLVVVDEDSLCKGILYWSDFAGHGYGGTYPAAKQHAEAGKCVTAGHPRTTKSHQGGDDPYSDRLVVPASRTTSAESYS